LRAKPQNICAVVLCANTQACGADPANLLYAVLLPKAIIRINIQFFLEKSKEKCEKSHFSEKMQFLAVCKAN
jgi:hypothetical protein